MALYCPCRLRNWSRSYCALDPARLPSLTIWQRNVVHDRRHAQSRRRSHRRRSCLNLRGQIRRVGRSQDGRSRLEDGLPRLTQHRYLRRLWILELLPQHCQRLWVQPCGYPSAYLPALHLRRYRLARERLAFRQDF